jgi:hypothetical protein
MPQAQSVPCALARTPARSDRGVLELFCSTFLFQDKKVENIPSRRNRDQKEIETQSGKHPSSEEPRKQGLLQKRTTLRNAGDPRSSRG